MTASVPVPSAERFIGCDIGQNQVVVFDSHDSRIRSVANTPVALAAFADSLDATCLVVCEATGGHEAALLAAMSAAGRAAHRADARKVKAFIRSFATLGKTDAIDARALAQYGQERHRRVVRWQPCDEQRARLQTLVATRSDLVADRTAWQNRRSAPLAGSVDPFLAPVLAVLDTQIELISHEIEAVIMAISP